MIEGVTKGTIQLKILIFNVNSDSFFKDFYESDDYQFEPYELSDGEKERIYIEVKSDKDGLKINQAKWLMKNGSHTNILCFIRWIHGEGG